MAIRTTCPGCDAAFKIPDEMNGQQVRCKACQTVFVVRGDGWHPPAPVAAPPPAVTEAPPGPSMEAAPVAEGPPIVQPIPTVSAAPPGSPRPRPAPTMRRPAPRQAQATGTSAVSVILGIVVIGGTLLVVGGVIVAVALFAYEMQRDHSVKKAQQTGIANRPPGWDGEGLPMRRGSLYDIPLWQWDSNYVAYAEASGDNAAKSDPLTFEAKDLEHDAGPRSFLLDNPVPVLTAEELKATAASTDGSLPRDVVQRVEDATVRLRVMRPDGPGGEGTGFFAFEPGILVTNAHVVGMKQNDSAKPTSIEVFVNSGEPTEKKLSAQVLVADGHIDLAILKIREKDFKQPEPLKLVSATMLRRTQQLVAFGFPYGEHLNKRLSTSKVSMASTMFDGSELHRVQLNGELNPGNSGGPVVDSQGRVVGVAVSIIRDGNPFAPRNTGISFAVPADHVQHLYQGRMSDLDLGQATQGDQADRIIVPVSVQLKDPLERIKRVGVEWWVGEPDQKHAASFTQPSAADGQRQTLALELQKGRASGQLTLPPLPEGKVYLLQPFCQGKKEGTSRWANTVLFQSPPPVERRIVTVTDADKGEKPSVLRFTSRSRLAVKGEPAGNSSSLLIDLTGQVKASGTAEEQPEYTAFQLGVRLGDRGLPRSMLQNILNRKHADQARQADQPAFSKAGEYRQELAAMGSSILSQWSALQIKLPAGQVKPGQTWKETRRLAVDVVDGIESPLIEITCTYLGLRQRDGREEAVVSLEANLAESQNVLEAKPTGRLTGTAWVDPATNQVVLVNASFDGTLNTTDRDGDPTQLGCKVALRLERGSGE